MGEVLQRWVAQKTGRHLSLEAKALREMLADGELVARVLHSYFVVDLDLRQRVRPTTDPAQRRLNWLVVRGWLSLLNVSVSDEAIEEIANAQGSAAGRTLYQLYLRLQCTGTWEKSRDMLPEPKARAVTRFKVERSENIVPAREDFDHLPATPQAPPRWLNVNEWFLSKYSSTLARISAGREDFRRAIEYELGTKEPHMHTPQMHPDAPKEQKEHVDTADGLPASPAPSPASPAATDISLTGQRPLNTQTQVVHPNSAQPTSVHLGGLGQPTSKQPTTGPISEHGTAGHNASNMPQYQSTMPSARPPSPAGVNTPQRDVQRQRGQRLADLLAAARRGKELLCASGGGGDCLGRVAQPRGPATAGACLEEALSVARRRRLQNRRTKKFHVYRRQMERLLPAQVMDMARKAQDEYFDELISKKLLLQAQFEKQMVAILIQTRHILYVVEDNCELLHELTQELLEYLDSLANPDAEANRNMEKQLLKERTLTLLKWMDRKQHETESEKDRNMCAELVSSIVDVAVIVGDYRKETEGEVPDRVFDEWITMTLALNPLFETPSPDDGGVDSAGGSGSTAAPVASGGTGPCAGTGQDLVSPTSSTRWSRRNQSPEMEGEEMYGENDDMQGTRVPPESDIDRIALIGYLNMERAWAVERCRHSITLPTESGLSLIGHIVNRLLEMRHPTHVLPPKIELPNTEVAAAALGVREARARNALKRLLDARDILMTSPEEAVMHCLQRYFLEIEPYEDDKHSTQQSPKSTTGKKAKKGKDKDDDASSSEKSKSTKRSKSSKKSSKDSKLSRSKKPSKKQSKKSRKESREKKKGSAVGASSDAETDAGAGSDTNKKVQVPQDRLEDPGEGPQPKELLPTASERALLGKQLAPVLRAGRPLTDAQVTLAILRCAEAALQDGKRGWVLVNFPRTPKLAIQFEERLTGNVVPPPPKLHESFPLHPLHYFAPFAVQDEYEDEKEVLRVSRLYPNPTPPEFPCSFESYLHIMMTARLKHCSAIRHDKRQMEECPRNAPYIDRLYSAAGISYSFYQRRFDLPTIRHLAAALLYFLPEEEDGKSKEVVLDNVLMELEDEFRSAKFYTPSAIKKRDLAPLIAFEHLPGCADDPKVPVQDILADVTTKAVGPLPGMPGWPYVNTDLKECGARMGSMWEAAESEYSRGIQEVLGLQRARAASSAPFMHRTRALVRHLVQKHECKQALVDQFMLELAELAPEMREDADMKAEWHLRAIELKEKLYEMCDKHREDADVARRSIATDLWIAMELAALANLVVALLQLELDLHVASLQVITDYYTCMLGRGNGSSDNFQRLALGRLDIAEERVVQSPTSGMSPTKEGKRGKSKRVTKQSVRKSKKDGGGGAPTPHSTPAESQEQLTVVVPALNVTTPSGSVVPPLFETPPAIPALAFIESTAAALARALLQPPPEHVYGSDITPEMTPSRMDTAPDTADVPKQGATEAPLPHSAGGSILTASSPDTGPSRPTTTTPASQSSVVNGGRSYDTGKQSNMMPPSTAGGEEEGGGPQPMFPPSVMTPVHHFVDDAITAARAHAAAMWHAADDLRGRERAGRSQSAARKSGTKGKKTALSYQGGTLNAPKAQSSQIRTATARTSNEGGGSGPTRKAGSKRGSTDLPSNNSVTSDHRGTHEMSDEERLALEWETALEMLQLRIDARIKLIECHAHSIFEEFLSDMFNLFYGLHDEIFSRHDREIAAVDLLIDILQLAIEDEGPLGPQLVLEGDRLFARPDRLLPCFPPREIADIEEPPSISMGQVSALARRLSRLAPGAVIPERALLQQLVELTLSHAGDGPSRPLPVSWQRLRPPGLQAMLDAIYGRTELVDWRELIIRAMELPWPTEQQLLKLRSQYMRHDLQGTELVSPDVFDSIPLWYEKEDEILEDDMLQHLFEARELIGILYTTQQGGFNYTAMLLQFCKDPKAMRGLAKALAVATGKRVATEYGKGPPPKMTTRRAAAHVLDKLLSNLVNESETPYLAWLPDEERDRLRNTILGKEPAEEPQRPETVQLFPRGGPGRLRYAGDERMKSKVSGFWRDFVEDPSADHEDSVGVIDDITKVLEDFLEGTMRPIEAYTAEFVCMPVMIEKKKHGFLDDILDILGPKGKSVEELETDGRRTFASRQSDRRSPYEVSKASLAAAQGSRPQSLYQRLTKKSSELPMIRIHPDSEPKKARRPHPHHIQIEGSIRPLPDPKVERKPILKGSTSDTMLLEGRDHELQRSDSLMDPLFGKDESPWLLEVPFDLAVSVLSASLLGVALAPPPLLLGPHLGVYPRFRGLIDLLMYVYADVTVDSASRWSIPVEQFLTHPLIVDLVSFTTHHFYDGSLESSIKVLGQQYADKIPDKSQSLAHAHAYA